MPTRRLNPADKRHTDKHGLSDQFDYDLHEKDSGDGKQNTADMTQFVQTLLQQMQNRFQTILTPQLHESAGDLPSLKLSLHSCSLSGSTNAMGIETSIALVLPAREHECDTSFVLRRPPALS
ncbi:heat shock factor-binding protein 1-like protein 1 [Tanacetum coccineum]